MATFLLEPTTAPDNERLLSKALIPVRKRDVQEGPGAFAVLLIVPNPRVHGRVSVA